MAQEFTFKQIVLEMIQRFSSRKFLYPLIYIAILILNYTQNWELPEELLTVVAGLLGIYTVVEGVKDVKVAKAT